MTNWKIEKRSLQELKGYDKNPRKFTKKGLKDLKASLKKCGDANIITINADNTVLGGHARLTVMKELGYETVDVKVPDRLLNEKEVQEIVIRLNANTAGEWDIDKLVADFEVSDLEDWGLDLDFTTLEDAEADMPTLDDGEKKPFQQMTFTLAVQQAEFIKNALAEVKKNKEYESNDNFGNENTNGNALYLVVPNSQLHFGCFLNGILGGVMSFGPSTDKKKPCGLIL